MSEEIQEKDKKLYSEIRKSDGTLAVPEDDYLGKAIKLERSLDDCYLGSGGESIVVKAKFDIDSLLVEGWRQLYLPILTHINLEDNSQKIDRWQEHYDESTQTVKKLVKKELEEAVKSFYEKQNILGKDRTVALRINKDNKDLVNRVERIRKIVGLYHPNIAYHFCAGKTQDNKTKHIESTYYGLVELIDAGTLEPKHTKDYPIHEILDIFRQIVFGLNKLKKTGILHRDIKPSNLFLKVLKENANNPYQHRNVVKIGDYGLMRPSSYKSSTINTLTGSILGTPIFMSPEQASGENEKLDWKTDQYSTGATMYSCLSGKLPIFSTKENPTDLELVMMAKERKYRLDSILTQPDATKEALEMILGKMMQIRPGDRYDDYETIIKDLERADKGLRPKYTGFSSVNTVFRKSEHRGQLSRNLYKKVIAVATLLGGTAAALHYTGKLQPIIDYVTNLMK